MIDNEEVNIPLFADDIILYIENLKGFTKINLLELRNKFNMVAGYKNNI